MTVEVFSGGWPDYPYEREALLKLAESLVPLNDWYLLLARVQIPNGGRPDLIVVKRNAVFVIDLKHSELPVYGTVNGPWLLKDANGAVVALLNEGREKNPYQQVDSYWQEMRGFLKSEAKSIWPERGTQIIAKILQSRFLLSSVVIHPQLQPGSRVNLDFKVTCISMDYLHKHLWAQGSSSLNLDIEEGRAIVRRLGATPWEDVHSFLNSCPGQPHIEWNVYADGVRQKKTVLRYTGQRVLVKGELATLEHALYSHQRLLLYGPAGSGKTTNLRNVFVRLLDKLPDQVPIWVDADLFEPRKGLPALVKQALQQYGVRLADHDFERLMSASEIVLLIEGWTEVPPVNRQDLHRGVRRWFTQYPQHRCIIAARRYEAEGTSNVSDSGTLGSQVAELQPFSDEELRQFTGSRGLSAADFAGLPSRLREVAHWPLYAELIVQLWEKRGSLDVSSTVDLVEAVMGRELGKTASLTDPLRDELDEFVSVLASEMHHSTSTVMTRDKARKCIRNTWRRMQQESRVTTAEEHVIQCVFESPVILNIGNRIRFAHQLFQEFFAGRWLADQFESNLSASTAVLTDPWWANSVLFATALAGNKRQVLEALVEARSAFVLGRCLAGDLSSTLAEECRTRIQSLLAADQADRELAVQCLAHGIDDPWAFEHLLNVITSEQSKNPAGGPKSGLLRFSGSPILEKASHPFQVSDRRVLALPIPFVASLGDLSEGARWACTSVLADIALFGRYEINGHLDLLVQALAERADDPSPDVRVMAVKGLGDLGYREHYRLGRNVPQLVTEALNRVASSTNVFLSTLAVDELARMGELEIDPAWVDGQAKSFAEDAERAINEGNHEIGASLASNYYDEVLGPVCAKAIELLGPAKFEKVLILALDSADGFCIDNVIWHLSYVGGDASVGALVDVVLRSRATEDPKAHQNRLAAANALACIGTERALSALRSLLENASWDVRLAAVIVLQNLGEDRSSVTGRERLAEVIRACWVEAGRSVLECLWRSRGGVIYSNDSLNSTSWTTTPMVDEVLNLLPKEEVLQVARSILSEGKHAYYGYPEVACHILGLQGSPDDLPLLRDKLRLDSLREAASKAMVNIQERI